MRSRRLSAIAVTAALLLAACAGLIQGDPSRLVLTVSDLPAGFQQQSANPYSNADVAKAFGVQPDAVSKTLARISGYRAMFVKPAGPGDLGPTSVDCVVSLYQGAVAARKALDFEVQVNRKANAAMQAVDAPTLGDQSQAFTWVEPDAQTKQAMRVYAFYWRQRNALVAVSMVAPDGSIQLDDALAVARN